MADNTKTSEPPIVTFPDAKATGSRRYFTGKPCKSGHVSERYVSSGDCVVCTQVWSARRYSANSERLCAQVSAYQAAHRDEKRAYNAAYRAAHLDEERQRRRAWQTVNRERYLAKLAAWRAANPDRVRANNAAHWAANRDDRRAYNVAYHAANRVRLCAEARAYYVANLAAKRAYEAAWRVANRATKRNQNSNRRAMKREAGGKHSVADVLALFKLQHGKCAHPWCAKSLASGYHVDHVIPLSHGGSNDRRNLALLCQPCNNKKWAHDPIDFAQRHGMLL